MQLMANSIIRIGTRASPLARWQAEWVASRLAALGVATELVPITTQGDVKSQPLGQIGGQGLFTKELQKALLDKQIDLAVHSLKDLPTEPVEGLVLAAVPERESTADVLISPSATSIESLPKNARVGTGSLRRKAQLLHIRADLSVLEIRGNVETRLKKLDDGEYDAIILAEAGLSRLGLADRITAIIPKSQMLPAVGQGALGLETRALDETTNEALRPLDHPATHLAVLAERMLLHALRAGCLAPVGALAVVKESRLILEAAVLSADGRQRIVANATGAAPEAASIGKAVANDLIAKGATQLITAARSGAS